MEIEDRKEVGKFAITFYDNGRARIERDFVEIAAKKMGGDNRFDGPLLLSGTLLAIAQLNNAEVVGEDREEAEKIVEKFLLLCKAHRKHLNHDENITIEIRVSDGVMKCSLSGIENIDKHHGASPLLAGVMAVIEIFDETTDDDRFDESINILDGIALRAQQARDERKKKNETND